MAEITREHLELAALAAGKTIVYWTDAGLPVVNGGNNGGRGRFLWCPHRDDGDAVRLAVRLGMLTDVLANTCSAAAMKVGLFAAQHNGTEPDKMRAWREAVVLCAAAVGAKMKGGA